MQILDAQRASHLQLCDSKPLLGVWVLVRQHPAGLDRRYGLSLRARGPFRFVHAAPVYSQGHARQHSIVKKQYERSRSKRVHETA